MLPMRREIDFELFQPRRCALNKCDESAVRRPWWDRLPPEKDPLRERVALWVLQAFMYTYGVVLLALAVGGCIAVWRSIL